MERTKCVRIKQASYRILSMLLILIVLVVLSGCYQMKEKAYYCDLDNFITEEAAVDNIIYNEKYGHIVLWLSDIDEAYQDSNFIIKGENARIVLERGGLDKIIKGDTILFTSAPGYFGDGYFMPIVALTVQNEELLSFDEGYRNLMEKY